MTTNVERRIAVKAYACIAEVGWPYVARVRAAVADDARRGRLRSGRACAL